MPVKNDSLIRRIFPTAHRLLLDKHVKSYLNNVRGSVLIIGAGIEEYQKKLSKASEVILTDISPVGESVLYADVLELNLR